MRTPVAVLWFRAVGPGGGRPHTRLPAPAHSLGRGRRGDLPSTAVFDEGLATLSLSVHGESANAKSERAELLSNINAAHLLSGAGEPDPAKALPVLANALAVAAASESPFNVFIKIRLSAVLRGLWGSAGAAAAGGPAVPTGGAGFVPRAKGAVLPQSVSEVRVCLLLILPCLARGPVPSGGSAGLCPCVPHSAVTPICPPPVRVCVPAAVCVSVCVPAPGPWPALPRARDGQCGTG